MALFLLRSPSKKTGENLCVAHTDTELSAQDVKDLRISGGGDHEDYCLLVFGT
jgi:hypothetical protein